MATTQELIDGLQSGVWKICDQDALTVRLEKVKPTRGDIFAASYIYLRSGKSSVSIGGDHYTKENTQDDAAEKSVGRQRRLIASAIDSERAAAVKEVGEFMKSQLGTLWKSGFGSFDLFHAAAVSMNITLD